MICSSLSILHCIVHCSWKVGLMALQGEGKSRSDQSDNIEFNFCGVSFVSSTLFYFMVFFVQVHNPLRLLLVLSCVLLLTCLAARFTCEPNLEDHLVIAALVLAWPYSLTFCRCDNKFTLFCPLKHYIYLLSAWKVKINIPILRYCPSSCSCSMQCFSTHSCLLVTQF